MCDKNEYLTGLERKKDCLSTHVLYLDEIFQWNRLDLFVDEVYCF